MLSHSQMEQSLNILKPIFFVSQWLKLFLFFPPQLFSPVWYRRKLSSFIESQNTRIPLGKEVGNLVCSFIFHLWIIHLKNDAVSLIILKDHKEIISNKAENRRYQGQVIGVLWIQVKSHCTSPYWKGQEWFLFKILNAFYLNNENRKWKV